MYIMRKLALLLLITLLLSHSTVSVSVSGAIGPLDEEILGLITFKSSLIDPNHALSTWTSTDETPCWWSHVQCDPATSHVVSLSLDSLSLSGPPLFRGLDRLQSLESLSLSNNRLSGSLPPGLSLLPRLKVLDLSRNLISGRLPEDLGSISSLASLELSDNALSGPIPASLFAACPSLRYLSLGGNLLEGPIPPTLSNCRFLLNLNLSNNRLSGSPDLVSLSRMRVLDVSSNSLSGPVSDGFANLHNLKSLNLSNNGFSGPIPSGLALCSHLNSIDLSGNGFSGPIPSAMGSLSSVSFFSVSSNNLSGDLPEWIGDMVFLKLLDLSGNKLTGEIPESIGGAKELKYLSLSGNLLTGGIPLNLFALGLEVLDLSSNKLVGSVRLGSRNVTRTVRSLDLSDNRLTGVVPAEVGYFKNMSVLDLRRNGFSGVIPGEICDSGGLSVLQLDGNSLSGSIPKGIGNCSSLYLLSLSHNSLTGPIPVAISTLKKLQVLKLEFNNLNGEIPQQLGTLNNLLSLNISHNRLTGRLPEGAVFESLDRSALQGNPGLCSPLLTQPCQMSVPKPLVLDPNEINNRNGSSVAVPGPTRSIHGRFFGVSTIVAISVATVVALGVVLVCLLNVSARRNRGILDNALESICSSSTKSRTLSVGKTVLFGSRGNLGIEDLVSAESLLSKAVEIGRGAFGTMYKSYIGEGRVVAIKKLITSNIIQSHEAFDREIRILAKARHPNLMPVKGYHWTPQLQMLISEFAPNGSLQARLHESEGTFPWASRFNVALGTANGLAYLHRSFRPPIVHYNITPSNILLDENYEPRVSDFGLAKLLPKLGRFQSAMGYVAPELASGSPGINEKCDVYAFGVIVLEMVTGRKPVEYGEDDVMILIDTVRVMLEGGNVLDCVDSRMGEFPVEEVLPVLKLGIVCTSQVPSSRPTMAEVVQILQVIKIPTVVEGMEDAF